MIKKYLLLLHLLYFVPNCFSQTLTTTETGTYYNDRFNYSITFPKNILHLQNESDNGDGLKMLSKDAKATVLVYGQNNALGRSLLDTFLEASAGGTYNKPRKVVSYKIIKNNWFVVSGYESGNIFYQKTFLINNQFKSFYFTYPEAQRNLYDPITNVLSQSFNGDVLVSSKKFDNAVVTFSDGTKYVGEFKDGKPNGQGTRTSASGVVLQSGLWVDGTSVGSAVIPAVAAKIEPKSLVQRATQGDAEAQYHYGMKFINGTGDEVKPRIAIEWLMKAQAQGHEGAKKQIASMFDLGIQMSNLMPSIVVYD